MQIIIASEGDGLSDDHDEYGEHQRYRRGHFDCYCLEGLGKSAGQDQATLGVNVQITEAHMPFSPVVLVAIWWGDILLEDDMGIGSG